MEPGDAIVVPYREERRSLELLQSVAAIVSTVTGVILTGIAIFSR